MVMRGRKVLAVLSAVALSAALTPAVAFAANGVQSGTETYNSSTDTWVDSSNAAADGAIDVVYDTTGGTWKDPGTDGPTGEGTVSHPNGTFVVTLPKLIQYENMPIGTVSISDDYTVNVRGVIESGKVVTLTAETGKALTAGSSGGITETTTQGKTEWTTDDCFGSVNTDGSLSGTNCTDTIALSGLVTATGDYVGYVQYNATVSNASSNEPDVPADPAAAVYARYSDTSNLARGTSGGTYWWVDSENVCHVAPIDGVSGAMAGYSNFYGIMNDRDTSYSDTIPFVQTVIVEDGVTSVGTRALAWTSNAENGYTAVHIAASVTAFGSYPFLYCDKCMHDMYFYGSAPSGVSGCINTFDYATDGRPVTVHIPAGDSSWDTYVNNPSSFDPDAALTFVRDL